jgi:hypothetical protein
MLAIISFLFLALFFALSPWLVKLRVISEYQRRKLKIFVFYQIPSELIIFLLILVPIALFYVIFYLISGDLKQLTEADLPSLTINLPLGLESISFDDFELKYSLSGWWNILFLAIWVNLIRYLYKIIYIKFPYSRLECSGYTLLILLTAVMLYFSLVGGSPLYGLAYNAVLLICYFLTHILICLGLWFLKLL